MVSSPAPKIDDIQDGDELARLKIEIVRHLEDKLSPISKINKNLNQLTVGIEHEFFLVNLDNKPVSKEASAEFMLAMSSEPGWSATENFKFEAMGDLVWRVSHQDEAGRITSIKYEHHPHHFELVIPLCQDLHQVKEKVEKNLELITKIAAGHGLKMVKTSILNISSFDKSVMSDVPYFSDLRKYRTKLFLRAGEAVESEAINFPAVISSTKTVIGGVNWLLEPEVMQRLFLIEPKIQSLILPRHNDENGNIQTILRKRWHHYLSPLKYSPLAGFPRISEWNIDEWISAIMRTPLPGPADKDWTAKTLNELKHMPHGSPASLLSSIAQLQMISPKSDGTITFNSDYAQNDIKYLMNLAALRLGLTAIVALGLAPKGSLAQSANEWKKRMSGDLPLKAVEAPAYFAAADKGLRLRKQAEEKYLVLM